MLARVKVRNSLTASPGGPAGQRATPYAPHAPQPRLTRLHGMCSEGAMRRRSGRESTLISSALACKSACERGANWMLSVERSRLPLRRTPARLSSRCCTRLGGFCTPHRRHTRALVPSDLRPGRPPRSASCRRHRRVHLPSCRRGRPVPACLDAVPAPHRHRIRQQHSSASGPYPLARDTLASECATAPALGCSCST